MKAFFRTLFRPLTFILSGSGFIVCGGILATNAFDENDPRETAAGVIVLTGGLFWAIALITLAIRFVRWFVRRKARPLLQRQRLPWAVRWYRLLESALVSALLISFAVVGAVEVGPMADNQTLDSADPAMVTLANEAGMSHEGTLIFLRTHPRLVSDSEMQSACAENTAANNAGGFIEQGCYVPATNQIYLRQMPDDLHAMVTATAAYEMLHPVYIALHQSGRGGALDAAIENNYTLLNDSDLTNQVENFAKTEPGARDLELFSLLGTGYSNLTDSLAQFYTPYFDNLGADVTANSQVKQLFQSDEDQLSQMDTDIKQYDDLANNAYATSIRWAQAGSQYEDDYYYNLYRQYLSQENSLIDQYNSLLDSYNTLVTEYNGTQPVQRITPAQTQSL